MGNIIPRSNIFWFAFLVGLFLLCAGCSNLESSQPPDLNTPSLQQSSTVEPQAQRTSTSSPVPEETGTDQLPEDTLTPTSISQINLGKSVEVVNGGIPGYGEWSPVEDRISFLRCNDGLSAFQLTLHNSPNFEPIVIFSNETACDSSVKFNHSWSPNGEIIVFSNLVSSAESVTWLTDLTRSWQFEEIALPVRYLTDFRWMDNNVFIEAGTGYGIAKFRNVTTATEMADVSYKGLLYKNNDKYLPIEIFEEFRHYVIAVSRYDIENPYRPNSKRHIVFPISSLNESSDFMDWRHRTQYMLVRVVEGDGIPQSSKLVFWNVDTGEIPLSIPDAVFGRVSPDGRWFAYMPYIFPENTSPVIECDPGEVEMKIMDLWDQQVKYSLPVKYGCNWDEYIPHQPKFSFSPDGTRLAYYQTKGTTSDTSNDSMVSILDLSSNKLVGSFNTDQLLWSPSGRFVILKGDESGYSLYDLSSGKSIILVTTSGKVWVSFNWSPSDLYIAIQNEVLGEPRKTIIIKNPLLE